jgi:hypothetical protein
MDLAKIFDQSLQRTVADIGGISEAKSAMAHDLAALIKANMPQADSLLCLRMAEALITLLLKSTQENATHKGIDSAQFGKALASTPSLKEYIVAAGFELFVKSMADVRQKMKSEAEVVNGIFRSNSADRNGVAIDGEVFDD